MRERNAKLALSVLCASVLAVAGCATGTEREDNRDSVAASVPETTTTVVSSTATQSASSSEASAVVKVTSGLVYHRGDDRFKNAEATMDVVAPTTTGGPWPVVVAFHGDPRSAGKSWMLPMATDIADQGRVVFVPDWGHTTAQWQSEASMEDQWDSLVRELRCAVVFAKSNSADY